jgi:hypothetical protein
MRAPHGADRLSRARERPEPIGPAHAVPWSRPHAPNPARGEKLLVARKAPKVLTPLGMAASASSGLRRTLSRQSAFSCLFGHELGALPVQRSGRGTFTIVAKTRAARIPDGESGFGRRREVVTPLSTRVSGARSYLRSRSAACGFSAGRTPSSDFQPRQVPHQLQDGVPPATVLNLHEGADQSQTFVGRGEKRLRVAAV